MPAISQASAAEPAAEPKRAAASAKRAPYPGLAAALAREAALRARRKAEDAACATGAYRLLLRGPLPSRFAIQPEAMAPASLERAQDLLRGRFALPSGVVQVRDRSPFDMPGEEAWRAELHRFEWLAHLEKAGGGTALSVARALTEDWLDRFERFGPFTWRADILGARVVAWAAHFRMLNASGDLLFRSRLLKAAAEQTRHLERYARQAPAGLARLEAACALGVMAAAIPEGSRRVMRAEQALRDALDGALLDDGGMVTRSPREQALAVAALARLSGALDDARLPKPPGLAPALLAARNALACVLHGDGRLACFNGSAEDEESWLSDLLDGTPAAASQTPSHWGYARLSAGISCVVFDCGGPPPEGHAVGAHAGPLAFEFSQGRARMVVNGGVARRRGGEWIAAARHTAAHATLQINESDAGAFLSGGRAAQLGARLYGGKTQGRMDVSAEGLWAEGHHDFYQPAFAATHIRRLFLAASGEDLRGEDRLMFGPRRPWCEALIRFPLHPDCRATLAQSGDSILIAPHGGEAWRFRADLGGINEQLTLEPHVYMGGETVRNTQAIVIRATPIGREWNVRWAFKVEAPYKRARRRLV
jgi:uncharacterized heparinase superfamily protein